MRTFINNSFKLIIAVICLVTLFSSCKRVFDEEIGENGVEVKVYLGVTSEQLVESKAITPYPDDYINPTSLFLLAFDGNTNDSKLLDYSSATLVSSGEKSVFLASLSANSSVRNVYVTANFIGVINENLSKWQKGTTTLGDIKKDLISKPLAKDAISGVTTNVPNPQPMVGVANFPSGLGNGAAIGSEADPVLLVRSTAQVVVSKDAALTDFEVIGGNLCNVSSQGYLFSSVPSPSVIDRVNYGVANEGQEGLISQSTDGGASFSIYAYETPINTDVIVKAKYKNIEGYYRLKVLDKTTLSELSLDRNFRYSIKISKVITAGYRTAAEALRNEVSNIEYTVDVTDPDSHDVISNGKYYLGVEYSELYVYKTGELTNYPISIVTHNAPSTVEKGVVTVKSAYIDGANIPETNVTDDIFADGNTGTVTKRTLILNTIKENSKTTIEIRLGNLLRVITVYNYPNADRLGTTLSQFSNESYVSAKSNSDWIKLDKNSSGKGFSAKVQSNVGYDVVDRDGTAEIFRQDNGGNTKIVVFQAAYNVHKDKIERSEPWSYVASFHRWNQTAERIIRVPLKPSETSETWRAFVVVGEDFIRLSTTKSPDSGISKDPYGIGDSPIYTTDEQIENNCQLTDGTTEVSGTGGPVYFRIGLTDKLASVNAAPRYGLVAVSIGYNNTSLIYVRQGEASDYLMRTGDKLPAGTTRPLAARLTPYNLTYESNEKSVVNPAPRSAAFVQYPSQGGYLIHSFCTSGWWATGADPESWHSTYPTGSSLWRQEWESCPVGYRRPDDGTILQYTNVAYGRNALPVENSELRQSLYLEPKPGQDDGSESNMLRGYIADGYYDRREMSKTETTYTSFNMAYGRGDYLSKVGTDTNTAYVGSVMYNPYNFASVFFPAVGYRSGNGGGKLQMEGCLSYIVTRSSQSDSYSWGAQIGFIVATDPKPAVRSYSASHPAHGYSVRCVKE